VSYPEISGELAGGLANDLQVVTAHTWSSSLVSNSARPPPECA
jgi:hypothetical protein